jgi:hypothetical protein
VVKFGNDGICYFVAMFASTTIRYQKTTGQAIYGLWYPQFHIFCYFYH